MSQICGEWSLQHDRPTQSLNRVMACYACVGQVVAVHQHVKTPLDATVGQDSKIACILHTRAGCLWTMFTRYKSLESMVWPETQLILLAQVMIVTLYMPATLLILLHSGKSGLSHYICLHLC